MKTVMLVWIGLITLPLAIYFGAFLLALIVMHPQAALGTGMIVTGVWFVLTLILRERERERERDRARAKGGAS